MDQSNIDSAPTRLEDKNIFGIVLFVAIGIFATTLPQPQVLGKIPLQNLLKNELHVSRSEMAFFFLVCGLFWYIKPLAGILTDAFPIFGTRRRHYALISAVLAAGSWIALIFAPHKYGALLLAAVIVNLFMVMLSTVVGAVLVEIGHSTGSVGRLTAVRQTVSNVCTLIQGPLGGILATGALAWACGANALLLLPMVPVTYFLLKEQKAAGSRADSISNAKRQLSILSRSSTFWWALVFITLFYFAPGFSTLLYYRQNDVLKLNQPTIGLLTSLGGLGGIIGAVAYGFISRRFSLRALLVFGIITAAVTTFMYLAYDSFTLATVIDFSNGLFFGFAEVAFIDLAARATPKGCEGLGYSLILSFRNFALFGADFLGSKLADEQHWSWASMVILNGVTTGIVIVLLPLIPKATLMSRDQEKMAHVDAA
jgi:MFS family permease